MVTGWGWVSGWVAKGYFHLLSVPWEKWKICPVVIDSDFESNNGK